MASTQLCFDYFSAHCTYPPPKSFQFSIPLPKIQACNKYRAKNSSLTIHSEKEKQTNEAKKKGKPRPSFLEQVQHKWSVKPISSREKFPWQDGNSVVSIEEEHCEAAVNESGIKVNLGPWIHGTQARKSQVDLEAMNWEKNNICETRLGEEINVSDSVRMPWQGGSERERKSNAELAEKLIPEAQLKRLRNAALRMVERIKVGSAGVTQDLVDSIHNKWRVDEIVKLKFEGPPSHNMKRTHDILQHRTGGLVIWRSGSSIVLYRGISYNLSKAPTTQSLGIERPRNGFSNLSGEEIMDLSELNMLLDEAGPRFKDWSGREPLPVDADLLPAAVPGYRPPFRRLPYGVKLNLKNKDMTYLRRSARIMPPHFALGRNRELQGLAVAIVKLWRRSAIAKIAIKRGVQNTSNERMAEELKVLTGGTLVSRNKDYIVFYRGNDFLPPGVTEALVKAERKSALLQGEEEEARQRAAANPIPIHPDNVKRPLVAGTLSETIAATSRWGNQPSIEARKKMLRDAAVARHASLVKYLQQKLALANGKVKKAENMLRKLQENLQPSQLPSDLETLSAEERFLFRKMGLSMKPFLLLGRRDVFDGTIENMHLHWKYRELVKIIAERRRSSAQIRHIAVSLEAESGGLLVSIDKTNQGYAIIVYRGKNYQRPSEFRPKNLLTKRQALAHSIQLQRREALKHHMTELQEKIQKLKSELEDMDMVDEIDEETLYSRLDASDDEDGVLLTEHLEGEVMIEDGVAMLFRQVAGS